MPRGGCCCSNRPTIFSWLLSSSTCIRRCAGSKYDRTTLCQITVQAEFPDGTLDLKTRPTYLS
jgi:hypothetical protein